MQWLPPIGPETTSVRLPISAVGAWEATAALVSDDPEAARALWLRALRWEPALLLWAVCRAGQCGVVLRSLRDAASWLVEARDEAWRNASIPDHFKETIDRGQLIVWSRRVVRTLTRCRALSRISAGHSRPEAEFCALLAETADGLHSEDVKSLCDFLPLWHAERIRAWQASEQGRQTVRAKAERDCDGLRKKVRRRWLSAKGLSSKAFAPTSFLAAVSRLTKSRQLEAAFAEQLHEEKMASLAQLAYGATHEINNPLANIATRAQSLLVDEEHPERRRTLATIHSQAMRAYEMIANMMLFARPPTLVCEPIDAAELLKEAAALLSQEAESQQTKVHIATEGDVRFSGDRRQLLVAVRAALQNALEAVVASGDVRLMARCVTQVGGPNIPLPIELTVSDTGPGLDAKTLRHAFDPFFSGREAGRGLGFGLSWCWRIVTQHGGTVALTNQTEGGARLVIWLPETPPAK